MKRKSSRLFWIGTGHAETEYAVLGVDHLGHFAGTGFNNSRVRGPLSASNGQAAWASKDRSRLGLMHQSLPQHSNCPFLPGEHGRIPRRRGRARAIQPHRHRPCCPSIHGRGIPSADMGGPQNHHRYRTFNHQPLPTLQALFKSGINGLSQQAMTSTSSNANPQTSAATSNGPAILKPPTAPSPTTSCSSA
jgi:hypothetical protein